MSTSCSDEGHHYAVSPTPCTMSKRSLDESDSVSSQPGQQNDSAGRLPVHDLLSPNEQQSAPAKRPRNFIASVVCPITHWSHRA